MLPFHRRQRAWLFLLAGLLAAGCATETEAPQRPVATTPVSGGIVSFAQIAPSTLDPAVVYDSFDATVVNLLHAGLLRHDSNFGIRPDIAHAWRIEDGGTRYVFELRDDVRFHDGRPLDAFDVSHSVHRIFDLEDSDVELAREYLRVIDGVDAYSRGEAESIAGLQVVDRTTLEVRLARPYAPFLDVLASEFARIVPRPRADDETTDGTIGCGPFALEEWTPSQRVVLKRHPAYHAHPVHLDGIVIETPATGAADKALEGFLDGRFDLVELTTVGTARVESDATVEIHRRLELSLTFLAFTVDRAPFDDPKLRRAVAHAVDPSALPGVDPMRKPVATGVLPPGFPGYEPIDKSLEANLEHARALLADAAPLEAPLRIGIPQRGAALEDMARALCAQIEALGVDVDAQVLAWTDFARGLRDGRFDAFLLTWVADLPDPDSFYYPLFHSTGSVNHLQFADADVDAWLQTARGETDRTRRLDLYRRAERRILDDAVMIPLHFNSTVVAVRNTVKGFEITSMGSGQLRLQSVWLDHPQPGVAR